MVSHASPKGALSVSTWTKARCKRPASRQMLCLEGEGAVRRTPSPRFKPRLAPRVGSRVNWARLPEGPLGERRSLGVKVHSGGVDGVGVDFIGGFRVDREGM